jgi:hypothetical protein
MGIPKHIQEIRDSPNYKQEADKIIKDSKEYSKDKSKIINKLGNELLDAL